jgi:ATP-dependent Clp protease ATP-binding subunit ClpC
VFERFTEPARQVVVLAQDEARALNHNYIGTEHILLGLLREDETNAVRALDSLGVRIDDVRRQVSHIIGQGNELTPGQIPFTPRSKKVLDLALREAVALGHKHIGPEHILLGLARENDGVASRILLDQGADSAKVREEVLRKLGTTTPPDYEMRMRSAQRALERSRFSPIAVPVVAALVLVGVGILIGWLIWG